jgi:peptide/nickel transport system permease protein
MRSARRQLISRFLRHKPGVVALIVVLILMMTAVFADVIAPHHWRTQSIPNRFADNSREHLLGTDELGRDILSRIVYGARYSLTIGLASVSVTLSIGMTLGIVAGYYRRIDSVIMRFIDILMAFPGILLAIAIVAALGGGLRNTIIAIGINLVPGFARLTRSLVLGLREREFVTAARVVGATDQAILSRHIFVNLISPVIVYASLQIATAILVGATLSFLGLGVQAPIPEWGAMVSTARQYLGVAPHTFIYPTAAIFITVVAFNVLGDALRDTLDPTLRT